MLEERIRSAERALPCAVLTACTARDGPDAIAELCVTTNYAQVASLLGTAQGGRGVIWAGGGCVIPCPDAIFQRQCARPPARRGMRTSARVTVVTRL
eukprot:2248669-Prymnesium_polylepis.2